MNPRALIVVLAALSMLGALSIDAYLPALPTLARDFSITEPVAQQSLSAYMIGYAFMTLFYGTLSDSFGRRRVILFGLVMFVIGSLGSAAAPTFGWLCIFRLLQGLSGGAGQVVGRAMVSDLFSGKEAQKVVSLVSLVFGVAPAFAPIIGGWLLEAFGWRSIFLFTAGFTAVLCAICFLFLRESLAVEKRHAFHFKLIVNHYVSAASHRHFMSRCAAMALTFSGVSLYIGSAPVFVPEVLHLSVRSFGWLFIPMVGGIMLGSFLSSQFSHHLRARQVVVTGYTLMLGSTIANLTYTSLCTAAVPWAVMPAFFYSLGMGFVMPTMSVLTLEMLPNNRGLASSLSAFIGTALFGTATGVVAPLVFHHAFTIALAIGIGISLSLVFWIVGSPKKEREKVEPEPTPAELPMEV